MIIYSRKKKLWLFLIVTCVGILLAACKSYKQQDEEKPDSGERGTIHINADESFKPVIDEQVKVYESNHPDTRIIVHYKPEAECFRDFGADSIRMLIATKSFSGEERKVMEDSLGLGLQSRVVARDAIAVIVHPGAPDSLFTMTG